jgi:putative ABC transport system permease protein
MLSLAWSGVRHNPARYVATLVAIITGVAFFAATGFVSDRVVDALEGDVDRQYGSVDVAIVVNEDADESEGANFAEELRIPGEAADRMVATDGVEAGGGVTTGEVSFLAADGSTFGNDATGRLWIEDEELNPLDIEDGAAPAAAGEIAVDRGLADEEDIAVGDQVTILTLAGESDATVVGITRFGSSDALDGGGTVSLPAATAFDWLTSGQVEYQEYYLRGDADQEQLAAAVEPVVPAGFVAQTGDELRQDKRDEIGSTGRYLKTGLQAFAVLAMLVGGFVIYNTFSVIVSQRLRELAVMSAIGATPKQIKRALRYEGLVIGLLGSVLGVLVGFVLTFLLVLVLQAFGVDLPGSGIKIKPTNVIGGLLLGTLITVLSVTIPARRAAKTEPIEALRTAAVERSPFSRKRSIATAVLVVLGVAGLVFGGGAAAIGLGALALFAGVIIGGPIIAVAGARIFRPVMSLFGLEGRLATDNTSRNPQRTATTANALLIGVFLVTLVSVAGTSVKDFVVGEIKKLESADYLIASTGGTIDDQLVNDLESIDGVEVVVPFRRESVTLDGEASLLSTGDVAAIQEVADLTLSAGSFADLAPGTVAAIGTGSALGGDSSDGDGPALGSTVTIADAAGDAVELEVVAVIEPSIDTSQTGSFVGEETFDSLVGDTAPTVAFLDVTSGAQTDTKDGIEDRVALRPDIELTEGNALGRLIGSIFDFLINAVNGLLLMSVIIAVIGIVNTLSLSILERRRELGLLRAIGMTDRRVQRMVRLESMLIAALGTIVGLLLGIFVGWALIHSIDRLSDATIAFSLPGFRILLILVLGVGLGVLASLIPARRSTKLDVLDAIEST